MKKIFLPIFALILTAACSAPPPASREAVPAASPAAVAMTEADAIAKEKAIWETIKNKDYDAFASMLADDQIEVTSEGVFDKATSITGIKEFEPSEVVFSDWKFLSIDKDAFLISYTAKVKGKYKGKEFPEESGRATSAWVSRGGKWLAIYHQESPVKPPMPPPAAATKSPAAVASPASFPAAAATGPDAIANEKIVWDLFKAKNYEAFAALLAPDFFEVESDGVYDKAGAVKGVSGFDASKVELSDWKTVALDADAALVTYTSKMPPMPGMPGMSKDGERGTSIWVRRDGKWLGLFHQGSTPVEKPAPAAEPKATPAQPTSSPAK
jgi:hypothetical protein